MDGRVVFCFEIWLLKSAGKGNIERDRKKRKEKRKEKKRKGVRMKG